LETAIVQLFVPHLIYIEPFCGSCKVLFARDPNDRSLWLPLPTKGDRGLAERVNDLDGRVTNFLRVLQDPVLSERLIRAVRFTPFSRVEFDQAVDAPLEPFGPVPDWRAAFHFFIRNRQSWAANCEHFPPLSLNRCRGGHDEHANAWVGAKDGLPAAHARLLHVVVERMDALAFMARNDTPDTLAYCDPPYVEHTRQKNIYRYDYTDRQHAEFLDAARAFRGKVIISGYACELYDRALADWHRLTFDKANHTAGGKAKGRRTEVLWLNYPPPTGG
jgi:DNA adenine methylase